MVGNIDYAKDVRVLDSPENEEIKEVFVNGKLELRYRYIDKNENVVECDKDFIIIYTKPVIFVFLDLMTVNIKEGDKFINISVYDALNMICSQIRSGSSFVESLKAIFRISKDPVVYKIYNMALFEEAFWNWKNKKIKNKEERIIYTYIVYDEGNKMYKIGKTENLNKRLSKLRTDNSSVELILKINTDIEKDLHDRYDKKCVNREWFYIDKNDVISIYNEFKEDVSFVNDDFLGI